MPGQWSVSKRVPTLDRYWSKVDRTGDGCWPWTGGRDPDGYGIFFDGTYLSNGRGRYVKSHRWTHEQFVGPIPKGLSVLHSCDNPPCQRPEHLRVGTTAENLAERDAKGRAAPPMHGAKHPVSKLTADDVLAIRGTYTPGEFLPNMRALARKYDVSPATIENVVHRRTWKHI
jgi:hypothetical protein